MGAKIFKTRLSHIALEVGKFEDVTSSMLFLDALAQRSVFEEALVAGGKAHHGQRRSEFHGAVNFTQGEDCVGEMVQGPSADGSVEQTGWEGQRLNLGPGEVNVGKIAPIHVAGAPAQHAHASINAINGP